MDTEEEEIVSTIDAFRSLDEGEMLCGYLDGFHGGTLPPHGCSRSYLHGWRNGMIESDRLAPDAAYMELQRAFAVGKRAG